MSSQIKFNKAEKLVKKTTRKTLKRKSIDLKQIGYSDYRRKLSRTEERRNQPSSTNTNCMPKVDCMGSASSLHKLKNAFHSSVEVDLSSRLMTEGPDVYVDPICSPFLPVTIHFLLPVYYLTINLQPALHEHLFPRGGHPTVTVKNECILGHAIYLAAYLTTTGESTRIISLSAETFDRMTTQSGNVF
ncbi:hypothetical protein EG68_00151 [Paragonimus skrjabini miyazakii]|uniref:Uncharacterized protein n=1 Tax=Paragonimus skrjabini miyazakii TaxID=59628 RepID=A0A8S9Z6L6_9TREM|nr:hypothetical protein EG68_00151 [Paragonimus skrjabini miyazakii]